MYESQSPEKQSPTLPKPVDVQLLEAAKPFIFKATYPKALMEMALGEYWSLLLPDLAELYEAKTKKPPPENLTPEAVYEAWGGKWRFYFPMLNDMLSRDLGDKSWPEEPLYMTDMDVLELGEDGYMLSAMVYFTPKASFQHGEPKKINVHGIAPVDEGAISTEVDRRLTAMLETQSMEREKDGVIEPGDKVVCSVTPRINGEVWGAGVSKKSIVWVREDRLQPPDLYQSMLGKDVGNHTINFRLTEKFGPLSGSMVEADLVVHSVLAQVLPEWSDDVASRVGKYTTYEELLAATEKAVRAVFTSRWEDQVADAALGGLVSQLMFEPLPVDWVNMKATEAYKRRLAQFKGAKEMLFSALGVEDENGAMLLFYEASRREAQSVVALLTYGQAVGLERDRGETLGNLSAYLRRSVKHLIANHVVVCHDEE